MGSSDQSVAPKERVNIVYKSQLGGAQEEMELQAEIDDREYLKYHPVISIGLRLRL